MRLKEFAVRFWPLIAICLLTVLFFFKFFFRGLVPIPADITVGMYYPWLDYKWGYAVGVPVKNPLLSDVVSQFWVWRNLAIELFKSGQNPFWNPYSLAGSPLVPVFHSSFFSPFNLLFFIFDQVKAMSAIIILQPFLAALFTYLLLRTFKFSSLSSLLGAITFAFCGFMQNWLEWGNIGHTLLWLPALILLTEKYAPQKKKIYLLLLILSLGIALAAGHPQTFFYCFLVWFFYFVWRLKTAIWWQSFLQATAVSFVFVLVFSFLLLPAAESFYYSIRSTENYIAQHNYGFFPPLHLITFFAPDFFGNPATANWWGRGFNYQEMAGYFGLIPLILATVAFFFKDKKIIFWKIAFILSLLSAFKFPFGWLIYFLKIPLLSTASASRTLMITAFAGAILAAQGLERLRRREVTFSFRKTWIFWVILLGYGTAILIVYFLVLRAQPSLSYSQAALAVINPYLGNMKVGLRNLILPFFLLFLFQFLAYLLGKLKWQTISGTLIPGAILLLATAELFRYGWKYNPFIKPDLYFPKTALTEKLKELAKGERIERERGELLPPNMWIPYQLYSASGYDPVYPLNYARFLYLVEGGKNTAGSTDRYGEIENYSSPLIDFLGIRYIVGIKRGENSVISPQGEPSYKFNYKKLIPLVGVESTIIMENKAAFPRAFLVNKVEFSENEEEIAEEIRDHPESLKETAYVLGKKITGSEEISSRKDNRVEVADYQSGTVQVQVESKEKSFLVLTDTLFPGWKAFLDGKETKIYRTDLAFRGIFVPPGSHQLKFIYRPISFEAGLVISSLTIVFFGLFRRKIFK